ncbi:MAG TPA: hypothetical protein VFE17_00270, partial [Candidatus Baltobacteraceae bacterium]|nr:hypothetical protein [Candidatus Baltobacteraceae bacterium]
MMREDSPKALQALARIVSQGRDLSDVHPVLAKRALQELYDKADERAADEAANALWDLDFVWTMPPGESPEQQYIGELAAALRCTPAQAEQHLHHLWDRQNAPSALKALQNSAATKSTSRGRPQYSDTFLHETALRDLSRAQSRALLQDLNMLCRQLDCEPWQIFASDDAYHGLLWRPFLGRLAMQAGQYDEYPTQELRRVHGEYLNSLAQDQAQRLLGDGRRDGTPWTAGERAALQRVIARDPNREAHYDAMRPRDAWNELCALTGRDEPYELDLGHLAAEVTLSNIRYEISKLPQSEHIQGLQRAAHLVVDAPPTKGLAQRLGLGAKTTINQIRQKLEELTVAERRELSNDITPLGVDVEFALHIEGVDILDLERRDRDWAAPVEPSERIAPLREMSVRAAGYAGAWRYLTNLCE